MSEAYGMNEYELMREADPILVRMRAPGDLEIIGNLMDELAHINDGMAAVIAAEDDPFENPLELLVKLAHRGQEEAVERALGQWITEPWTEAETVERVASMYAPDGVLMGRVWVREDQLDGRLAPLKASEAAG